MSWHWGQWPRILLCCRSSFQDKSLRSVSPNMRAIWFLACQSQSSLLRGCKRSCRSRNEMYSGRFSVNDTQLLKAFMIKLYRSKDSGKISRNYIIFLDITILLSGNANTKKYSCRTFEKLTKKENETIFSNLIKIAQQMSPSILYLCAISFHNRGPSSTSASEVSHMTINWNVSWPKHQRVDLAFGHPLKKWTRK